MCVKMCVGSISLYNIYVIKRRIKEEYIVIMHSIYFLNNGTKFLLHSIIIYFNNEIKVLFHSTLLSFQYVYVPLCLF